eukprot:m.162553 g.162553  ORF g.162553 m.162553 type:complete len:146 (-) comp17667_c1_seq4:22-459(-)
MPLSKSALACTDAHDAFDVFLTLARLSPKDAHGFDFWRLASEHNLDFYERVKLINFVRYQVQNNTCPRCEKRFDHREALLEHLEAEQHFAIDAEKSDFRTHPQYLFPAANAFDPLLCCLETAEEYEQPDAIPAADSTTNISSPSN